MNHKQSIHRVENSIDRNSLNPSIHTTGHPLSLIPQSHLLHEFEVLDGEVDEPSAVADLLVEGGPLVLHRLQLQPDRLRLRRLREEALRRADEVLDLAARVLRNTACDVSERAAGVPDGFDKLTKF